MGVLGIAPFLYKTCPHVFKTLPDRLCSLRGTTVAIDGTLVTQRLHFAPMPHPHRHIIGWHRILSELRDARVHAICVFDGKQRAAAKVREIERRRLSRRRDAVRSSIEQARLHRLHRLMCLLPYYRSLPGADRQRISDALSPHHRAAHVPGSALVASTSFPPRTSSLSVTPGTDPPSPAPHPLLFPHPTMEISDAHDTFRSLPSTSRFEPHYMPPPTDQVGPTDTLAGGDFGACHLVNHLRDDAFSSLPFVHGHAAMHPTPSNFRPPPDSAASCQSELSTLYCQYRQSISQLTSIPPPFRGPDMSVRECHPFPPEDDPGSLDTRVEHAVSKQQLQMTVDEGRIWNSLIEPPSHVLSESESALLTLAERSTLISRSYQRRSNPPTKQTYEECRELLRAMGVPCIDAAGPFEAEALACALVIHGHADYVASEDTDVLVYEAPMLRGITARESPLVVVHGEAVRASLQLDRASYVDFALLLGTDFSQRIKNVGPHRALRFIRQHGSIERVVERETKYPPRVPVADYLAQVDLARLVFQNLPPLPDLRLCHETKEDPDALLDIIQKYRLHRALSVPWETHSALSGNYFDDDPSVW